MKDTIQQIIKEATLKGYIPELKNHDCALNDGEYTCTCFERAIDSFQLEKIIELAYEKLLQAEKERLEEILKDIRVSWDIADGGSEWCVQIWQGNTLLESLSKNSDDGGSVRLFELFAPSHLQEQITLTSNK